MSIINEDVDVATIKKMSEDQFQELLRRSNPSRRNQLNAMRQTSSVRMKDGQTSGGSRVTTSDTRPSSSASLTRGGTPTTRPSLLQRSKRVASGAGRIGTQIAADAAAELAINQIQDPKTREKVRGAKELAVGALTPVYSAANIPSGGAVTRSDLEVENPFGYGGKLTKDFSRGSGKDDGSYADWLKSDLKGGMLPTWLGGAKAGPKYNDPRTNVRYTTKDGQSVRVGAAKRGGEIEPVEWGSVAGIKKVGTPQDVAAVKARQQASTNKEYGATAGSALVGTGGRMDVNMKANTITTGGKTVQLPKTKVLPSGKVGDLAYRNGKPVYLARGDMAIRGNQNLLARMSRATGIGGQRERDAAALAKEKQQAQKSFNKYKSDLGIKPSTNTTKSAARPAKSAARPATSVTKPVNARSAQAYAASKGKYYSNTTGKTYANYAAALKDIKNK